MKSGSATYYDVSDGALCRRWLAGFDPTCKGLLRSLRVFDAIPCGWPDFAHDRVVVLALVCVFSLRRIARPTDTHARGTRPLQLTLKRPFAFLGQRKTPGVITPGVFSPGVFWGLWHLSARP